MSLGNELLNLRKKKGLSQEEAAIKLDVTRQTISKWETDQSTPDFDKILPLCNLYNISANELLTGIKDKETCDSNINKIDNFDSIKKKKAFGICLGILIYFIAIAWIMISVAALKINPIIASGIFLIMCGIATFAIVYSAIVYKVPKEKLKKENLLIKQIDNVLSTVTVIIYLLISFTTYAWHITWVIWLVYAIIIEIVKLVFMLKGDIHEK